MSSSLSGIAVRIAARAPPGAPNVPSTSDMRRRRERRRRLRKRRHRTRLEHEQGLRQRRAARDRPLDVLVATRSGVRRAARPRRARRAPRRRGTARRAARPPPPAAPCRDPPASGTYSTCFELTRPAHDLARDLAHQVVVRRHLAADDRDPEAPARVDRHHARVAADGVAREEHAGDLGVHHQLDGDAHRRLRLPGPSAAR